jgi:hypothetical protein
LPGSALTAVPAAAELDLLAKLDIQSAGEEGDRFII